LAVPGECFEDLVGGLVQIKGFGSAFQASIQAVTSASRSLTLRWAERRSLRLVSSANHRSTRLSHDEYVGVKCRWNLGCLTSHWWMAGVVAGLELLGRGQAGLHRRRGQRGEEGLGDGGVDGLSTDVEVPDSLAVNEFTGAVAVVAGVDLAGPR
jgi:hypothetical protein